MNKQSKITVKHYLEKRLKRVDFTYPVYCYITYKRQTTKFKSFTGVYLSELEFEKYSKNQTYRLSDEDISNIENDKTSRYIVNSFLTYSMNVAVLEKEIKAIKFLLENYIDEADIFKENFIQTLGVYFNHLGESITDFCWSEYTLIQGEKFKKEYSHNKKYKNIDNSENKYQQMVSSLNLKKNLITNIEDIKEMTSIDLSDYFSKNILVKWKALKVILFLYGNSNIIDFIIDFNSDALAEESIDIKLKISKEVFEEIFKDYKQYINDWLTIPF